MRKVKCELVVCRYNSSFCNKDKVGMCTCKEKLVWKGNGLCENCFAERENNIECYNYLRFGKLELGESIITCNKTLCKHNSALHSEGEIGECNCKEDIFLANSGNCTNCGEDNDDSICKNYSIQ